MTKDVADILSEMIETLAREQASSTKLLVEAIDRNTAAQDRNATELKRMNDIEQYKQFPSLPMPAMRQFGDQ